MVDLPQIPRRLVTTQAARSEVSAADVAAPFTMLASGLDSVRQGIEHLAVKEAEVSGAQAVTRDQNGDVRVALMPNYSGRAGEAHNRAAMRSFMSRIDGELQSRFGAWRVEYEGRPQEFRDAAGRYIDELEGKYEDPRLAGEVRMRAERHAVETYNGLLARRAAVDSRAEHDSITKRQQQLENELTAIVAGGGNPGDEAFQGRQEEWLELERTLVANPAWGYPAERSQYETSRFTTRMQLTGLLREVSRVANDKGTDELGTPIGGVRPAKAVADSILTNPDLNLNADERRQFHRVALAQIRSLSTENRVLVSQLSQEGKQWERAIEKGEVDPDSARDALDRMADAGAAQAWTSLTNAISRTKYLRDWFDRLPADERARVVPQIEGRPAASGDFVTRLVNRESGGRPAVHNAWGFLGSFQFGAPRLADLGLYRPAPGESLENWANVAGGVAKWKGQFDIPGHPEVKTARQFLSSPEAQRAAWEAHRLRMDEEIRENGFDRFEGRTVGGVPITRDGLYAMLHLGGVGGARRTLESGGADSPRDRNGTSVLDYARMGASSVPVPAAVARDPSFLLAARKRQKEELDRAFSTMEKNVDAGMTTTPAELAQLGALVYSVGTPEQRERAVSLAMRARYGAALEGMSRQQREVGELEIRNLFGSGATQLEREVGQYAAKRHKEIAADYDRDPYGAVVQYQHRAPVPPLDFSNPASLPAAVDARVREQQFFREHEGLGPRSIFRPADGPAFRQALATAGAPGIVATFDALERLDNDMLFATLGDDTVREGLRGLLRASDPAKLRAGMQVLDRIYQRDPARTRQVLGDTATDRLRVWQTNLSWMTDRDIAEELKRVNDPPAEARRDANLAKGRELARKKSPDEVVRAFDSSWFGSLRGTRPAAPVDPGTRDALMGDFENQYAHFYSLTLDEDQAASLAIEKLKTKWLRSAVNGGALMLNAPELSYPQIDASHDWLRAQLEDDLAKRLGPRVMTSGRVLNMPGRPLLSTAWDYAIVGDRTTAAESGPGRTPSYFVMVRDNTKETPRWEPMRDANGDLERYRWTTEPVDLARLMRDDQLAAAMERANALRLPLEGLRRRFGARPLGIEFSEFGDAGERQAKE